MENEMDLFNNQVGREIVNQGSNDILQSVLSALNNGELRYISNQSIIFGQECLATFYSQLIPTNQ